MLDLCTGPYHKSRHRQAAKRSAAAGMAMIEPTRLSLPPSIESLPEGYLMSSGPPLPLNVCTERPRPAVTTLKNADSSTSIISLRPRVPGARPGSLNLPVGSPVFVSLWLWTQYAQSIHRFESGEISFMVHFKKKRSHPSFLHPPFPCTIPGKSPPRFKPCRN